MKKSMLHIAFMFAAVMAGAQQPELARVRTYCQARQHALLEEYMAFLSLPNTANDPEGLKANAAFILKMMQQRGIEGRLLEYPDAVPAVYGEIRTPGATTTLIFYAHYDGQPVDTAKWAAGLHPFRPRLADRRLDKGGRLMDMPPVNTPIDPEWRLYARAAADDKAGVFAILGAYDALRQNGLQPGVNIKFFFEGEEEKGSTNLGGILEKHRQLLAGDMWVIADGPMHPSGSKQVLFGVRGDVNVELTVYGAKRPLHSGNYGNWAPNPALKLAQLLAGMKDTSGRVLIEGFYDDVAPLSEVEKQALARIPDPGPNMQRELAFAQTENPARSYYESIVTLPTLNINGMNSANTGALASNIIPTTATATLDLRLVKGNDAQRQVEKLRAHIRKQGYLVLDREPLDEERLKYPNIASVIPATGYNAQRTSMDLPLARRIVQAVQSSSETPLILVPSLGGSLPLYLFEEKLHTPPLTVPVVNYDNNQHGENENLKIGCLFQGIETMAAMMLLR